MREFKDIEFTDHPAGEGKMGSLTFANGYGLSIVRFKLGSNPAIGMFAKNSTYGSYTNNENEWEVAILKNGGLCYSTDITDDVLGNQTEEDINKLIIKVSGLEE